MVDVRRRSLAVTVLADYDTVDVARLIKKKLSAMG